MSREPTPQEDANRCLTEEEAIGFVGRAGINEANIAGTLAHIEGCARCRRLVGEAARLRHESAPGARATSVTVGERLGGRYEILARVTPESAAPHDEVTFDALDHHAEVVVTVRTFALGLMAVEGRVPAGARVEPDAADPALAAASLARVLRPVVHPNLRRVLDAGVHQRTATSPSKSGRIMGIPWVALELVEGDTLDEHIGRAGPLSTEAALPIVTQLVAALSALHAIPEAARYSGFFARSVVLAPGEGSGGPRVVLDPLAPERLTTSDRDRGQAGDIRALGAVMFHMLGGASSTWDEVIGRCLSPRGLRRFRVVEDVRRALTGARGGWASRWLTPGRAR